MDLEASFKELTDLKSKAFKLETELGESLMGKNVRRILKLENKVKLSEDLYRVEDIMSDDFSGELWIVSVNGKGDWVPFKSIIYKEEDNI